VTLVGLAALFKDDVKSAVVQTTGEAQENDEETEA